MTASITSAFARGHARFVSFLRHAAFLDLLTAEFGSGAAEPEAATSQLGRDYFIQFCGFLWSKPSNQGGASL